VKWSSGYVNSLTIETTLAMNVLYLNYNWPTLVIIDGLKQF